jgi:DNA-binding CsgD family transcriptional regulator
MITREWLQRLDSVTLTMIVGELRGALTSAERCLQVAAELEARATARRNLLEQLGKQRQQAKLPRNMRIMRLARQGHGNQEIGRRVGLSAGQVSRIIRRELLTGRARLLLPAESEALAGQGTKHDVGAGHRGQRPRAERRRDRTSHEVVQQADAGVEP